MPIELLQRRRDPVSGGWIYPEPAPVPPATPESLRRQITEYEKVLEARWPGGGFLYLQEVRAATAKRIEQLRTELGELEAR